MNLVKITAVALIATVFSCSQKGEPGPAGKDGSANVFRGTVTVSGVGDGIQKNKWVPSLTSYGQGYSASLSFPASISSKLNTMDSTTLVQVELLNIDGSKTAGLRNVYALPVPADGFMIYQGRYTFNYAYLPWSYFELIMVPTTLSNYGPVGSNSVGTIPGTFVFQVTAIKQ